MAAEQTTPDLNARFNVASSQGMPPSRTLLTPEPSCKDEARVGQQGTLTRLWAARGSRPPAPRDCRYEWAYIFGAVCPARGAGAALVLPYANAEAMNLHLAEIGKRVSQGAHAVVTMDGAGWHQEGGRLQVPDNISLLVLPPYSPELLDGAGWHKPGGRLTLPDNVSTLAIPPCSPELNPQENVWQYLRQNYLANRVFDNYETIVDACCDAWNSLIKQPDRITSIASREWALPVKL